MGSAVRLPRRRGARLADGVDVVEEPHELESFDVKGKEVAALRWANHVSDKTPVTWRYLLVGEKDIEEAHGSWAALKGLGRS